MDSVRYRVWVVGQGKERQQWFVGLELFIADDHSIPLEIHRYGAEADEIWSIDETLLEQLEEDGVQLPILDVGIAHGEKARGGAY